MLQFFTDPDDISSRSFIVDVMREQTPDIADIADVTREQTPDYERSKVYYEQLLKALYDPSVNAQGQAALDPEQRNKPLVTVLTPLMSSFTFKRAPTKEFDIGIYRVGDQDPASGIPDQLRLARQHWNQAKRMLLLGTDLTHTPAERRHWLIVARETLATARQCLAAVAKTVRISALVAL